MSFCFTTSILLRCCGVSLLHIIEVALAVEGLLSLLLPFNCSAFDCIGRGYCSVLAHVWHIPPVLRLRFKALQETIDNLNPLLRAGDEPL
jgi:hypothetical protein